jgi:hypothetical protein
VRGTGSSDVARGCAEQTVDRLSFNTVSPSV